MLNMEPIASQEMGSSRLSKQWLCAFSFKQDNFLFFYFKGKLLIEKSTVQKIYILIFILTTRITSNAALDV